MSTLLPGFQSFFRFFALFLLAKLATSSIRVKVIKKNSGSWPIPSIWYWSTGSRGHTHTHSHTMVEVSITGTCLFLNSEWKSGKQSQRRLTEVEEHLANRSERELCQYKALETCNTIFVIARGKSTMIIATRVMKFTPGKNASFSRMEPFNVKTFLS